MLRDPFLKGLRDQLRPLVLWVVGIAFYVALLMSIYPSIRGSAKALQGYIDHLPAAVKPRRRLQGLWMATLTTQLQPSLVSRMRTSPSL